MEILAKHTEDKPDAVNVLRFLLKDNAFHEEFLLTCVLEYIDNNKSNGEEE